MKIIAHRCGTDKFPELTIDSAKYSLNVGASLVEMDIHFTSDNIPVISHDTDCKFLFGNDYKINEITSKVFLSQKYQDGSGYGAIKLEDMLAAGISNILFHIKVGGDKLYLVLDLCRKYKIEDKVVFGIGSVKDLKIVKNYNPEIKALAFLYDLENLSEYTNEGVDYIRLWEHWLTEENLSAVKNSGKKLWIMAGEYDTVGYTNPDNFAHFKELGADAVLVNNILDFTKN